MGNLCLGGRPKVLLKPFDYKHDRQVKLFHLLDGNEQQRQKGEQMLLEGTSVDIPSIIHKLYCRAITGTEQDIQLLATIIQRNSLDIHNISHAHIAFNTILQQHTTTPHQRMEALIQLILSGTDDERLGALQICAHTFEQNETNSLLPITTHLLNLASTPMCEPALAILCHLARDQANHKQMESDGVVAFCENCKASDSVTFELFCGLAISFPDSIASLVLDSYVSGQGHRDTTVLSTLLSTCSEVRNIFLQTGAGEKIIALEMDLQTKADLLKVLYEGHERRFCELLLMYKLDGGDISHFSEIILPYLMNHAIVSMNIRNDKSPWFIESDLLPPTQKKYSIIDGQPRDLTLVADLYAKCPVPGYELRSVRIVHNEHLTTLFSGVVDRLEERHLNATFQPQWKHTCKSNQEYKQREQVMALFASLSHNYHYDKAPHVSFLPLWHGSNPAALESLFTTGFANLASTDAGFFGKGLYATANAEYAYRVYSKGALLINWVAVFSAFPVIAQDEADLAEGGNFETYDAHFAPVFADDHPNTTNYHACKYGQQPQYTELVVFESAQMLPHYIVELQPSLIPNPPILYAEPPATTTPSSSALEWSPADVLLWVSQLALSQDYTQLILQSEIDGRRLMGMTKNDWRNLGINNFGDVRMLVVSAPRLK